MQIRTKLTLQFITIGAGILLLALVFIYAKFRQITECEFFDNLRTKALMTAEMALHEEDQLQPLDRQPDTVEVLPAGENIIIYNAKRQRIFAFNRNASDPPGINLFDLNAPAERRLQREQIFTLCLRYYSRSGQAYFIVAESIFHSEDLAHLRNILMITFFLGVSILAASGWFFAGQAMAPVSRIVNQVDQILPSGLGARVKLDTRSNRDEISRLVLTFNNLLDRIQFAFLMQKNFISNVSHELKNPLSVIIAQLEVALNKQRDADEYRTTLVSILDDARNLNEVADKLLQLARVHSENTNVDFDQLRLDEALLQTRDTLLRMHPDYRIVFDIEGMPEREEQLYIRGNDPLLRLAFLNLMDNGCKFSPDKHAEVKIIFNSEGRHRVEFIDHGPGISPDDLRLIFQPFYRSPQSRHIRGSGIGLTLVDSILKIHQIALEVLSGHGRGTIFRLNFPQGQA